MLAFLEKGEAQHPKNTVLLGKNKRKKMGKSLKILLLNVMFCDNCSVVFN